MTDTPAQMITATLARCEQGLQHQDCPDRAPGESATEYQHRCLAYALNWGIAPLTLSQLEQADTAAAARVAQLPARMEEDADAQRLDRTLHALRLRIQTRAAEKRATLARLQRLIDQTGPDTPPADPDAVQGADMVELESDADRAARLLRAALVLIMGGQEGGNGGGRPARLQPPPPTRPSPGQAQQPPHVPAPRRF